MPEIHFGDLRAPLVVKAGNHDYLKIGAVTDLHLTHNGVGETIVASLANSAVLNLDGMSTVVIEGGDVDLMTLNLKGIQNINYKGTAKDVVVNGMGKGSVDLNSVTGKVTHSIWGNITLTVNGNTLH